MTYNIALPIDRLAPVVDFAEQNEKTFQQLRASTFGWGFVGRSFDLRPPCCIRDTAQNSRSNPKKFNSTLQKVRAMSFLTTRDPHDIDRSAERVSRYNGIAVGLDKPKVIYKYLLISSYKKCGDIKEQL